MKTLERCFRPLLVGSVLIASIGPGSSVRATTPSTFGMGPRAIALAGASTALSEDAYATFYNPAGLAYLTQTTLTVATIFVKPMKTIQRIVCKIMRTFNTKLIVQYR